MTWTTRWHIDKNEIPKLKRLLDIELSKPQLEQKKEKEKQDKIKRLYRSIWGWGNVTKMDDDIVARAKANGTSFTGKNGIENSTISGLSHNQINFVGANGGYSYTTTASSSNTTSITVEVFDEDLKGMSGELIGAIFGKVLTFGVDTSKTITLTIGESTEETRTTETSIVSFFYVMLFFVIHTTNSLFYLFYIFQNNNITTTKIIRDFIWKMKVWVIILMSRCTLIPFLVPQSFIRLLVNQCALLRKVLLRVKKCKSQQRLPQSRIFPMVNLQCLRLR